ncbi:MAG: hypothetical protein R8M45_03580 [Ghiorsea sp.]
MKIENISHISPTNKKISQELNVLFDEMFTKIDGGNTDNQHIAVLSADSNITSARKESLKLEEIQEEETHASKISAVIINLAMSLKPINLAQATSLASEISSDISLGKYDKTQLEKLSYSNFV